MQSFIKLPLLTGILLTLSACQSTHHIAKIDTLPQNYKGIWQSNGYGYLLDMSRDEVALYDITEDRCLYNEEGSMLISKLASGKMPNATFETSNGGDSLTYIEAFETYPIQFKRLKQIPQVCLDHFPNDPLTNFEFFADYMQTHYAFFDLYGVDWQTSVSKAKPLVTNTTGDDKLFELFSTMLKPLKDAHLSLTGALNGKSKRFQPETSTVGEATAKIAEQQGISHRSVNRKLFKHYKNNISDRILMGQGKVAANDWIQYGIIPSKTDTQDIGYIALMSTYNYAGHGVGYDAEDRAILKTTLDDAISWFNSKNVKAVIVDVSINVGGYSFPATDIAARFSHQTLLAFSKRAYDTHHQDFFPVYVTPQKLPADTVFNGPVYLLAANTTVSGGEEVVLALRALPNVTHLGENTRGGLSDILSKTLPNGWTLDLSNEIYMDPAGKVWEGDGIPPDQYLKVFDKDNPFNGHVDAVNGVVDLINHLHRHK